MPKHRHRGVKRDHTILEGFDEALERIAALDAVQSVIPGRIAQIRSSASHKRLTYQYPTDTGAKLQAKGGGAVQEIFVVTEDPERVRRFVSDLRIDG